MQQASEVSSNCGKQTASSQPIQDNNVQQIFDEKNQEHIEDGEFPSNMDIDVTPPSKTIAEKNSRRKYGGSFRHKNLGVKKKLIKATGNSRGKWDKGQQRDLLKAAFFGDDAMADYKIRNLQMSATLKGVCRQNQNRH